MGAYRFLKLDPLDDYIEERLNFYKNPANVSKLGVWIKLTAGAGPEEMDGGLTIVSNPLIPTFGENSIHGSLTSEAPVGVQNFSGDPVGNFVGTATSNKGYRPRPIIEQVQVINGTRGLTRKAEFDIKCYSSEQTDLITQYFLEPGFTVALEWGWNDILSYGEVATTAAELASLQNYDALDKKRKKSEGTYDAYLGVVTGGGITQTGAEYTVSVELMGIGQALSYIQGHQNAVVTEQEEEDEPDDIGSLDIEINDDVQESEKESFAYMFNSLPEKWKTDRVSNLIQNDRVSDSNNFINFLPKVADDISSTTESASWWSRIISRKSGTVQDEEGNRISIPSGDGIIDEARYIRFGALMDILHTGVYNTKTGLKLEGENNNVPIQINTKNVPISAFKKIYSIDGSKLYIPNKLLPDFGLIESFSSTNPSLYYKALYDSIDKQFIPSFKNDYFNEFPRSQPLKDLIGVSIDESDMSREDFNAAKYEYGFLEDLFINFDFAMEIIQRKGLTMREVMLELLNGMASAVDNFWKFEIIESDKGGLTVIDFNFTGFEEKKDRPPPSLISNGTESSFTAFNFSIDIPGAMMDQIMARRLTDENASFQTDLSDLPNRLFGDGVILKDKIADKLEKSTESSTSSKLIQSPSQEEIIRQNFERFQKNATIISTITSYQSGFYKSSGPRGQTTTAVTIDDSKNVLDYVLIGAWDDPKLFKLIRYEDRESIVQEKLSVLLPIDTTFTTFGIGGIRHGHTYKIADLPQKYSENIFQITEVTHTISGMNWTTEVKGEMRQTSKQ